MYIYIFLQGAIWDVSNLLSQTNATTYNEHFYASVKCEESDIYMKTGCLYVVQLCVQLLLTLTNILQPEVNEQSYCLQICPH